MNSALTAAATGGIPNWFAVVMGIGTVFAGLVAIIVICVITGALAGNRKSEKKKPVTPAQPSGGDPRVRQELIAAVCAAAAEDMGTDVSRIRVISFKKL